MFIRNILLLAFLFAGIRLCAQEVTHQQSYWFRLFFQGKINSKYNWSLEADERRLIRPDRQLQFISHVSVRRLLSHGLVLSAGVSYSLVNEVDEFRTFQEFFAEFTVNKRFKINNRFRMEQRFFREAADDWDRHFRWRFRVQPNFRVSPKVIFKCSEEVMFQENGFDQNRVYGAFEFKINNHVSLETGYLKIFQKRQTAGFFDRDILRTTIYFQV